MLATTPRALDSPAPTPGGAGGNGRAGAFSCPSEPGGAGRAVRARAQARAEATVLGRRGNVAASPSGRGEEEQAEERELYVEVGFMCPRQRESVLVNSGYFHLFGIARVTEIKPCKSICRSRKGWYSVRPSEGRRRKNALPGHSGETWGGGGSLEAHRIDDWDRPGRSTGTCHGCQYIYLYDSSKTTYAI